MKVLVLSKALILAAYRRKLTELARLGIEVIAVVPPMWREGGGVQRLEPDENAEYEMIVTPIRLNGHFHLHYYPDFPRLLKSVQPELVHVDEEPYNLATYLAVRAAHRSRIPSLFFTWQNLLRRYPPPFRNMERAVYGRVVHAIAGSQDAASVVRAKGYGGPVSVVPQFGVDAEVYAPEARRHDSFTVGFLNRLIPGKGPLLAVEAFATLPSDARLVFVGDGTMRGVVEAAIVTRGLTDRVAMRERIPSAGMPDLLHGLDCVVLPSCTTPTWKEQFGRVLIEAMACGIPVIASDSGEIPRVVGDAGLIVPENNVQGFASALQQLYHDPLLRAHLASRGRARAIERFTHTRIASMTADVYRAAVA